MRIDLAMVEVSHPNGASKAMRQNIHIPSPKYAEDGRH